ncbi:MAG TPA: hypothetical protein VK163_06125 [Opitutaceae bacterium]|nr:hypothetical protein [Opitutaceae bacterium]
MPSRRNPVCHPMSAAAACRAPKQSAGRSAAGAPLSDDAFKAAVDRGYRQFWLRRGVDVDARRVNDI